MNIRNYITEVQLSGNPELDKLFNLALKQVFSSQFLQRIEDKIKKVIKVHEVDEKQDVIAYNKGTDIFINKNEFFNREKSQQVKYLLHEFIHVLEKKRGILFRQFKDIKKLTNTLNRILQKELTQPLSVFLTGKNQKLGAGGKWEILSYFMNDSINWNAVSPKGRKEIIEALQQSGIFNLSHPFWKKRLES